MVEVLQRYSKFANLSKLGHLTRGRAVPVARPRIHDVERRLGLDTVARLVADYESGLSSPQLMERYQLSKGAVLRLLEEQGVARKRFGLTAEQVDEAVRLYGEGWSLARLGERYGCWHTTVRNALLKSGVMLRRRQGWRY